MRFWLSPLAEVLERGEAAVLVHVVELKGSGPREVGAQMLVTETGLSGTIGGGELEHAAILQARNLLQAGQAALAFFALGPQLNQCCGGAVSLAFEPFAPADRAWVKKLVAAAVEPEPVFRMVSIGATGTLRRSWEAGGAGPDFAVTLAPDGVDIRERMNAQPQAVWLFGAGHVGQAVARALLPLGYAITWIDGRAGQLPDPPLPGVKQLALAMPELAVDQAPENTVFLVMTHSHPLDEAICEAVLRREDFRYLGLIGSKTKRVRFRKRLGEAGIASPHIARLVCPIGLPGITSKTPAAIAASVAADLLLRHEKDLLRNIPTRC